MDLLAGFALAAIALAVAVFVVPIVVVPTGVLAVADGGLMVPIVVMPTFHHCMLRLLLLQHLSGHSWSHTLARLRYMLSSCSALCLLLCLLPLS